MYYFVPLFSNRLFFCPVFFFSFQGALLYFILFVKYSKYVLFISVVYFFFYLELSFHRESASPYRSNKKKPEQVRVRISNAHTLLHYTSKNSNDRLNMRI